MAAKFKKFILPACILGGLYVGYSVTLPFTPGTSLAVYEDVQTHGDLIMRQTLLNRFSLGKRRYRLEAGFRYPDAKDMQLQLLCESKESETIRAVRGINSFYLVGQSGFWDVDYRMRTLVQGKIPSQNTTIQFVAGDYTSDWRGQLQFDPFEEGYVRSKRQKVEAPPEAADIVDEELFERSTLVVRATTNSYGGYRNITWSPVKIHATLKGAEGIPIESHMMVAHQDKGQGQGLPNGICTLYLTPMSRKKPELGWRLWEDYNSELEGFEKGYSHVVNEENSEGNE